PAFAQRTPASGGRPPRESKSGRRGAYSPQLGQVFCAELSCGPAGAIQPGQSRRATGGELVPLPEPGTGHLAELVTEPADMLAHSASTQRMELAGEAGALPLALDVSNSIKARDSIEKMLTAQDATAHKLAMRFMRKAEHQLSQVDTSNPKAWSAHSVEAARLASAAARVIGA